MQVRRQEGEDGVRGGVVLDRGSEATELRSQVHQPAAVRTGPEPGRRARVGKEQEVRVPLEQGRVGLDEGFDAVERCDPGAGSERRWVREDGLLESALIVVEQGTGETGLVTEGPVERPLPDAGRSRDLVGGHLVQAPLDDEDARRLQQARAVASCVRPWPAPPRTPRGFGGLQSRCVARMVHH